MDEGQEDEEDVRGRCEGMGRHGKAWEGKCERSGSGIRSKPSESAALLRRSVV